MIVVAVIAAASVTVTVAAAAALFFSLLGSCIALNENQSSNHILKEHTQEQRILNEGAKQVKKKCFELCGACVCLNENI